jgi:phage terminase large subunit-like protein
VVQRLKLSRARRDRDQGGKVARMFAAAPEWQAGDWFLDRNAAWTEPFVEHVITFPNGAPMTWPT